LHYGAKFSHPLGLTPKITFIRKQKVWRFFKGGSKKQHTIRKNREKTIQKNYIRNIKMELTMKYCL